MSGVFWRFIRGMVFRMDAEAVHHFFLRGIAVLGRFGSLGTVPLRIASGGQTREPPRRPVEVFGQPFLSRIGLAAGFDKDCEILPELATLGFGFAEIGTVTPRPQPGNDRPRLFRDPSRQAIFNRMGFNNLGALLVAERLQRARARLPDTFRVGVNIGKNKATSLEDAASDYAKAVEPFQGLADYVVINVSSPNTPGLRSLQTVEALRPIAAGVLEKVAAWPRRVPVLLKLAPEVRGDALSELLGHGEAWGISGWVLTNTLGGERRIRGEVLPGGWSGGPLTIPSREVLREVRDRTKLPVISVGGILTEEEARERRRLGADLLQIYTGWIYGGPTLPRRLERALRELEG